MDVILMTSMDNLGEMGQTVSVKRGYARNYLIPQGMAMPASEGNAKIVAEHIKLHAKRDNLRKEAAEELAKTLGEISCTISVQANEEEQLFGSVTARDIAEALQAENHQFERRQIALEEPIKQLGVYTVPVKLHPEVAVEAKVWVVKT